MAAVRNRPEYLAIFFFLFAVPLFLFHLHLFTLPYFWDEQGQFIPTALDILRQGAWVARSTVPNVHPPGVEAYLALLYKLFGYSIPLTRAAMLLLAGFGLLFTFLLAIELTRGAKGTPAFLPPLLLLASPLFFTQSMMAQLDMPAMVFTLLALLLFVKQKYAAAAVACVVLVLVKETGLVVPFVFFCFLVWQRDWKRSAFFIPSAIALAAWLVVLHRATGYWLGDPGFAHYNVGYALEPVHLLFSFLRRIYYLFFAEMRVVGTVVIVYALVTNQLFRTKSWLVTTTVTGATCLLVTVLGGAELERYLLPILPVFYIAVAAGLTTLPKRASIAGTGVMFGGLIICIFWNPPYPFPYENNYSMVTFVRLQQIAGEYADHHLRGRSIATAWPYSAALRNPDFGFVDHPMQAIETNDFHPASISALNPDSFNALITYTRTWSPADGVLANPAVRHFLQRFYEWQPDITPAQCGALGLHEAVSWTLEGQTITVYQRRE
jgi:4-amino-4-deoxy-L-arabinose transferase-like glycosyltransferase